MLLFVLGAWAAFAQPVADHHQHLLRSATAPPPGLALTAKDLIAQMDAVGVRRAVVLSIGYQLGNPNRPPVANEYVRVRAENNWTREQAALYPDRLVAFCGVNPLKDYALREIERCAKTPGLERGLKLHFGNSDVDLENPGHLARLKAVFRTANRHRMAIVAHIRSTVSRQRPWGPTQARVFLEEVLPEAPHVIVQVAHLAGAGGYDDPGIDGALGVFADALQGGDRRTKQLWIDVSGVFLGSWEKHAERIALRLRQIGMGRILFGSDGPVDNGWKSFRKLPLTEREFARIEANEAPYLSKTRDSKK